MPNRSWGSGSSNNSSSSSSRSSSKSSSHSSSYNRYGGDDSSGPTDPMVGYIGLGILVLIVVIWFGGSLMQRGNAARENSNATATAHSITLSDLAMMHTALDNQISRWQELGKTTPTYVGAEAAGFSKDSNTYAVVYGYCDLERTQFYVYVLNEQPPQFTFLADREGYAWIKNSTPSMCHPENWQIRDYVRVTEEAGWYFGIMSTERKYRYATSPANTETPIPTTTPEAF